MPLISSESVLGSDDLPKQRVEVPEWGEGAYLFVRTMMAGERDKFDLYVGHVQQGKFDGSLFSAKLVALTACDESGSLLFRESDVPALAKKNSKALSRIVRSAQRLNGLTLADFEAAKKNSETTPAAGGSFELPSNSAEPPES